MILLLTTNYLHSQKGKIEGVDQEMPPNTKIFDATNRQHTDNISVLARHRLAASRENLPQPITVNIPGFAELFAHVKTPAIAPVAAPGVAAAPNVAHRQCTLFPPTELILFCTNYRLSDQIKKKLNAMQIAGPHIICLISDADLQGEGALSIGELASVQDVQLRRQDELRN